MPRSIRRSRWRRPSYLVKETMRVPITAPAPVSARAADETRGHNSPYAADPAVYGNGLPSDRLLRYRRSVDDTGERFGDRRAQRPPRSLRAVRSRPRLAQGVGRQLPRVNGLRVGSGGL